MKILIVASDKGNHFVPFIEEQIQALAQSGVEIERFGIMRKGFWGYLCEMPRLCRTIKKVRPDVIHAHYGLSGLLAGLARQACLFSTSQNRGIWRIPLITTYHGSDINNPHVLRLSCLSMRLSAWNIFVSKRNMDIATKACPLTNCSLIPCGVNLSEDQLLTRYEARHRLTAADTPCIISDGTNSRQCSFRDIQTLPVILFAGAFDNPVKDAALAQRSVSVLNTEYPLLRDVHTNEVQMNALDEANRAVLVELRGYSRSEVDLLMCAADCLLLTSRCEGSPQVIKEAMACGCPIVSVDVGDVSERIAGLSGCYLATSRHPQAIAPLLNLALQYRDKTQGRQRIIDDGLSNKQVVDKLFAIYKAQNTDEYGRI